MVSESARNPRLGSLKMPQSSACKKLNMQIIMKKDFAKALIEAFSKMYLRFEGCCCSFSLLSRLDLVRIVKKMYYLLFLKPIAVYWEKDLTSFKKYWNVTCSINWCSLLGWFSCYINEPMGRLSTKSISISWNIITRGRNIEFS